MGGINSLSGLNNMNVDFRPTIQVNEQKPSDANRLLPEADAVPGEAQPPQKAEARSVVQATVTITKTNNTKIKAGNDIECVRQYNDRKCPSFFKREFLHKMFDKPQMAA